jgi:hypothetical protein
MTEDGTQNTRYANDLNGGLRMMLPAFHYDYQGEYYKHWQAIKNDVEHKHTAYLHSTAIPHKERNNIARCKYGSLWTAKKAAQIKSTHYQPCIHAPPQPDVPREYACPLCGQQDGAGHTLGGCAHPHMKGLVIERHNNAVRILVKALVQARKLRAEGYLVVDAGNETQEAFPQSHTRLPAWMVPDDIDPVHRSHLRPDILYVEGLPNRDPTPADIVWHKAHSKIHILEIGYCSDTRYHEACSRKEHQHQELTRILTAAGWQQVQPIQVIILGHCGTIFRPTDRVLRDLMGYTTQETDRIVHKLIRNTSKRATQLIGTRRHLERSQVGTIT